MKISHSNSLYSGKPNPTFYLLLFDVGGDSGFLMLGGCLASEFGLASMTTELGLLILQAFSNLF